MNQRYKISDIPPHERPMEKLLSQGARALSDADLLAVILRSGGPGCNALQLAYRILAGADSSQKEQPEVRKKAPGTAVKQAADAAQDKAPAQAANAAQDKAPAQAADAALEETAAPNLRLRGRDFLRQADAHELQQFPGIGAVKAQQIVAALELGRRVHHSKVSSTELMNSPERVWHFLKNDLGICAQEEMRLLLLDVKQRLIRMEVVAKGGLSSMVIQPREILRLAVRANAAAFIIAHNHPSGDPEPSRHDLESTRKIKAAAELIGIPMNDHVIVTSTGFCSLNRVSTLWSKQDF